MVVEVDDLHWVDATSEEFLSFLVEGLFAAHVLLAATYRSGYRPPWIEKSYATQISLARLTDRTARPWSGRAAAPSSRRTWSAMC